MIYREPGQSPDFKPSQGVGADQAATVSQFFNSAELPGRADQVRGRPSIALPSALRPNRFPGLPPGLLSVLSATTEKPPSFPFAGDFGLKPPGPVSAGFAEYVEVESGVLGSHRSPTESPFESLIKVPPALNLHGGFSQSDRASQTVRRPQKTVLAIKIPPAIIETQPHQPPQHHEHEHHYGLF